MTTCGFDLREDPDWNPQTGLQHAGDWWLRSWCEPLLPGLANGDADLVVLMSDRVRVAVLDSVSPAHRGVEQGEKWSQTALAVTTSHLLKDGDLHSCLDGAWSDLCGDREHPLDGPQCCLAAVDLPLNAKNKGLVGVAVYVAGDCDVWVRSRGGWSRPSSRQAIRVDRAQTWQGRPSVAKDPVGHWKSKLAALGSAEDWDFPPLGVGRVPRYQVLDLEDCDELVLASDGAWLEEPLLGNLGGWLTGGLQTAPAGWPHRSPHGDVALVHAALSPLVAW